VVWEGCGSLLVHFLKRLVGTGAALKPRFVNRQHTVVSSGVFRGIENPELRIGESQMKASGTGQP
jgi:hypothetical protein